ncbi:MAG: lysylphosphatidylglycerol synthase domain-containing protein [Caldilineaceae bacterium]
MNKDKLLVYARLLVSIVLLGALAISVDRQALVETFTRMRLSYYLLGVALIFVATVVSAYRWQMLLSATGQALDLWQLTAINLIGNFFHFLPTAVGGMARVVALAQQGSYRSPSQYFDRDAGSADWINFAGAHGCRCARNQFLHRQ